MDEVLNAVDTLAGELTGNDGVVGEGESLLVDLTVTSLVDELGDGGSGRETVSDERLDNTDHVPGGLVELDEDGVVELSQSKELEDLLRLGGKLVDTSNSNKEGNLRLSLDEEVTSLLGSSLIINEFLIGSLVFLEVLLGVSSSKLSGLGSILLSLGKVGLAVLKEFFISGGLLLEAFGNGSSAIRPISQVITYAFLGIIAFKIINTP